MIRELTTHDRPAPAGHAPVILAIGGTLRPDSTSERALRTALAAAEANGAVTGLISARHLSFPMYDPETASGVPGAVALLERVRRADGLIIGSPGYHGGISGLLKNALDYLQGLADDENPYLHDKAVGCLVTTGGWQAGVTTLTSLRSTVHALRGWPTPLGVVVNSSTRPYGPDGALTDPKLGAQLDTLGRQVVAFANARLSLAS